MNDAFRMMCRKQIQAIAVTLGKSCEAVTVRVFLINKSIYNSKILTVCQEKVSFVQKCVFCFLVWFFIYFFTSFADPSCFIRNTARVSKCERSHSWAVRLGIGRAQRIPLFVCVCGSLSAVPRPRHCFTAAIDLIASFTRSLITIIAHPEEFFINVALLSVQHPTVSMDRESKSTQTPGYRKSSSLGIVLMTPIFWGRLSAVALSGFVFIQLVRIRSITGCSSSSSQS